MVSINACGILCPRIILFQGDRAVEELAEQPHVAVGDCTDHRRSAAPEARPEAVERGRGGTRRCPGAGADTPKIGGEAHRGERQCRQKAHDRRLVVQPFAGFARVAPHGLGAGSPATPPSPASVRATTGRAAGWERRVGAARDLDLDNLILAAIQEVMGQPSYGAARSAPARWCRFQAENSDPSQTTRCRSRAR